ncbi:hypothetical protein C8R45DRAFT_1212973, partial [Mycena sanguinolenta]
MSTRRPLLLFRKLRKSLPPQDIGYSLCPARSSLGIVIIDIFGEGFCFCNTFLRPMAICRSPVFAYVLLLSVSVGADDLV